MKILYVTTIGLTMNFFKPLIKKLLDDGHIVDIAANESEYKVADCYREWGCKIYPVSCSRAPLKSGNLKAIKEIDKIVAHGAYDIVHCHTPIAAACTRAACRKHRKKGVKVVYTAHGFHFYKGAPKQNWAIFYPIEKLCSRLTDVLITINKEDYAFAQKHLHADRTEYIPGVGVDTGKLHIEGFNATAKRAELGISADELLVISVGELNQNKNHEVMIRAIAKLKDPRVHYFIAGRGDKGQYLSELANELNVNLHLLGYRTDIAEILNAADVFALPSFREGLPVALMEAMAAGLPCIGSKIRGNTDLIDNEGGILCGPDDEDAFQNAIKELMNAQKRREMGEHNRVRIREFDVHKVMEMVSQVYAREVTDSVKT